MEAEFISQKSGKIVIQPNDMRCFMIYLPKRAVLFIFLELAETL